MHARPRHLAAALLAALTLPAAAHGQAQTGGAQYASPAQDQAAPAAAAAPAPRLRPVVEGLTCRTRCAGIVRATPGSIVRLTGEGVEHAAHVVFLGRRGRGDDKVAVAGPVAVGGTQAIVPRGARTGPVRVITADRRRSAPSRRRVLIGRRLVVKGPAIEPRADLQRVFVDGTRRASVSFFARQSVPVSVDVLRPDGAVVAHFDVPAPPVGSVQSVEWDGRAHGAPAPEGRYVWRVAPAGAPRPAQVAAPRGPSFVLLAHRFPVAGPHTYGDGLGAGRGHQGADVFAACGTPLVAAIGGTVKHVAFHSRAGHYLVITGADGIDFAYMHLKDPPPVKKGQAVATGQVIGAVGDTGRASGCHLHFEAWSAPGWYTGGTVIDPMPLLRAWDAPAR